MTCRFYGLCAVALLAFALSVAPRAEAAALATSELAFTDLEILPRGGARASTAAPTRPSLAAVNLALCALDRGLSCGGARESRSASGAGAGP